MPRASISPNISGQATASSWVRRAGSAALQAARAAHEATYKSGDAQEGPRAFAEKRKPEWRGR